MSKILIIEDEESIRRVLKKVLVDENSSYMILEAVDGVLGLEAIEGTDELLKRCKEYKRKDDNGVLFKFSKQNQSNLIDIPLIGLNTMKNLKKYNYEGVFLQKNKCLILDKKKIIDYASQNNLFISSVELN